MMNKVLFILGILISVSSVAQNPVWEKWDPEVVAKAHTARDFEYYSEEEKKVVLFMNLARVDGPLFAETFLKAYVEENNVENNSYLRSLYKDLYKVSNLKMLIPENDLTSVAQRHADETGKSGHVGHKDLEKRMGPIYGDPYKSVSENISYGPLLAIDIVISLLIDDEVKGVGHRVNTLNPIFNSVGVSIREHKRYRYNCVIDFGVQDRSNLNDLPF